jgi:hypothetical protein
MEYWDVTAWLDSGERFFARFLVTNQGPGDRTAAATGHLVLANGDARPFRWGRQSGQWTLGANGRRLEIRKAVLDVTRPTLVVAVDTKKHGVQLRLEIDQSGPAVVATTDTQTPYPFEVVMPTTAHGTIAGRDVTGSAAIVHTWMDRAETDLIVRRDELLGRGGDSTLYLSVLTLPDGTHRAALDVQRAGKTVNARGEPLLAFAATATGGDDERYPVPREWKGWDGNVQFGAKLGAELLHMNPLEILPQPFRFLLSLGGEPHRTWADATITLQFLDSDEPRDLTGIAVSTFAGPGHRLPARTADDINLTNPAPTTAK